MKIHWFPGHMTKSLREISASLSAVDFVIYLLDSRAPFACINPAFDDLISHLPIIYALNKADKGDRSVISRWLALLSTDRTSALAINATASGASKQIENIAKKLCRAKLEKFQNKGIKTSLRGLVIGVPNSGKSTLVNNLCGSARAKTGNRAGVTRGKQWVRVGEYFEVLDTPGTLYPKIEDERTAAILAILGSIRDEVVDQTELACELVKELNRLDPAILATRYGSTDQLEPLQVLEVVARKRGMLLRGGECDIDRAGVGLIDDFRKGRLGNISFDNE